MIRKSVVLMLTASVLLSACDSMNWWGNDKAATTTSSAPTASVAAHSNGKASGTLSGMLLGSQGAMVDDNDLKQANTAETKAYVAPVGQQITWNNAQNGDNGKITPVKDGYSQIGAYCRQFQESVTVGGQPKQGYGTACQQPDGSWKIVAQ